MVSPPQQLNFSTSRDFKILFLTTSMPPIEHLYIHIPFCPKLCPYCCFYVEEGAKNKNRDFLDALLLELEQQMLSRELIPRTIYMGGGTPTSLLADQLEYLLKGLRARLPLHQLEEWTVEANPATIRAEKAKILKDAGINRVSLGVQSWNDSTLKTLGRVHSSAQAHKTVDILKDAGFTSINIDLMFSVPSQTPAQWEADLQTTIQLSPTHISAYCLTYEEDTEYFLKLSKGLFTQDESHDARLFELTMDQLGAAGYAQYEISNHARSGHESRHNIACWEGREYLGLGPSAFSTLQNQRFQNLRDTAEYVRRVNAGVRPLLSTENLDAQTLIKEKVAFGLRMSTGVEESLLSLWEEEKTHLLEIGLLEKQGSRLRLTRRGKMLADAVGESFMG
jgi:oxygen-independent coproporphyrinogen-3 oxidase